MSLIRLAIRQAVAKTTTFHRDISIAAFHDSETYQKQPEAAKGAFTSMFEFCAYSGMDAAGAEKAVAANILMDAVGFKSTADIDALLDKDPSRRHSPERSLPPGRWVQAAVSQPLPMPSLEDAMTGSFILTDF
ncbi:hypothetical protein EW145_g5065, partial [Phellinidium pouzarii]